GVIGGGSWAAAQGFGRRRAAPLLHATLEQSREYDFLSPHPSTALIWRVQELDHDEQIALETAAPLREDRWPRWTVRSISSRPTEFCTELDLAIDNSAEIFETLPFRNTQDRIDAG